MRWLATARGGSSTHLLESLGDRGGVVPPCVCRWQIKGLTGLNEEAAEALDFVCNLPERLR